MTNPARRERPKRQTINGKRKTHLELILKYFPDLTPRQQEQFALLDPLYRDWNAKINVISRKDIDALYEKHVLHSLGIAKVIRFKPFTEILDVGTGGGFPGIPLAIMFPQCRFHLVDSVGKKIKVVQEVAQGAKVPYKLFPLGDYFEEAFFETKQVVHVPVTGK